MTDDQELLLAEWKEIRESLRYFGNKRFAQLTVFLAIEGATLGAAYLKSTSPFEQRIFEFAGFAVAVLFFTMEYSSVTFWRAFVTRAKAIEKELKTIKLMEVRPEKEAATIATYWFYGLTAALWIVFLIAPAHGSVAPVGAPAQESSSSVIKTLSEAGFDKDLRWLLVSMLFAIVIAEIAIQAHRVISVFRRNSKGKRPSFFPIASHLLLVTTVVTTSWVGWSRSIGAAMHNELQEVVSWPFVLLLLDVLLLIFYFLMVRAPDIVEKTPPDASTITVSVAQNSFLLVLIFLVYFLWGVVDHLLLQGLGNFVQHGWYSFIGFLMALVIWLVVRKWNKDYQIVIANLLMVAIVISFRVRILPGPPSWLSHVLGQS